MNFRIVGPAEQDAPPPVELTLQHETDGTVTLCARAAGVEWSRIAEIGTDGVLGIHWVTGDDKAMGFQADEEGHLKHRYV